MLKALEALKEKIGKRLTKDLTKTYRPTEDWDMPIEEALRRLPPEAFEPAGERVKCRCRSRFAE